MKIKIAPLLIVLLLVGCKESSVPSDSSFDSSPSSSEIISSNSESSSEPSSERPSSSEIPSSGSTPISEPDERSGQKPLHFFGINDFHGAIIQQGNDPGIFSLSSYIKHLDNTKPGQTVKINAGDYWQGSADSNLNSGYFLTEAMDALGFDSFTLGNHEFDWYDTKIEANRALTDVPFLGANIISKATGNLATNLVHYDDTFKASTMITRNNVNIGIIGTIGSSLESSILYAAVAPYSFEPVEAFIRDEATNLREQGADMIVLSTHDSLYGSLGEYSDIVYDSVVDIIFSGHQHVQDNRVVNGIPILQTNGYGRQVMEVSGYYDFDREDFFVSKAGLTPGMDVSRYAEDPQMLELFAPYAAQSDVIKNELLGSFSSYMTTGELTKLATKVMYDYAGQGYGDYPIVAAHNTAGVRAPISAGDVTYGQVYTSFPFDNEIRIIEEIDGRTLNNFVDYYSWYSDVSFISNSQTYTLVTIDYLSTSSYYTRDLEQVLTGTYARDLIADFIRDHGVVTPDHYA